MKKAYILSTIYTPENDSSLHNTKTFSMFPNCVGTMEDVEARLNEHIERAHSEDRTVEEITSDEIHAGQYFSKVIKISNKIGGPSIYGISSVWEAKDY